MKRRRGMTLVEVVIGAVVAALILAVLSRLLSQGVQSSVKGASHLTNIQAGALILAHLEIDLLRARAVTATPDQLVAEVVEDVGVGGMVCSTVTYRWAADQLGLRRRKTGGGGGDLDRVLADGLRVGRLDGQPFFSLVTLAGGRFGVLARFEVATDKGKEPFRVAKFIFCGNAPANAAVPEWQRP